MRPGAAVAELLQLRVLRLGLLVDGNIRIGVLPQRQEILVRRQRSNPRRVGVRARRVLRLQSIRAGHAQPRQRSCPAVPHHAAAVENLLELGCRFLALSRRQVGLSAYVGGIKTGNLGNELDLPILNGR